MTIREFFKIFCWTGAVVATVLYLSLSAFGFFLLLKNGREISEAVGKLNGLIKELQTSIDKLPKTDGKMSSSLISKPAFSNSEQGVKKGAPSVSALIARLCDSNPQIVKRAQFALARLGQTAVPEALMSALALEDKNQLGQTLQYLAGISQPAAAELAKIADSHGDPEVVAAAQEAISLIVNHEKEQDVKIAELMKDRLENKAPVAQNKSVQPQRTAILMARPLSTFTSADTPDAYRRHSR